MNTFNSGVPTSAGPASAGSEGQQAWVRPVVSKLQPAEAGTPKNRSKSGFNRIDLTSLAGILVLLILIWFPALARTRMNNEGFQCLNNLKQLIAAMEMYTQDYHDLFPPNPDDGNTNPGFNWCPGQAGSGGPDEFNSDLLLDPRRSLLVSYIQNNVELFRCPADTRTGRSTAPSTVGHIVPSARTISMSQAVGTDPYTRGCQLPVNGGWLDGAHTNTRNGPWLTYGSPCSILTPTPARLFVLLDENPRSLNDACFAVTMVSSSFLDCPAIFHNLGATFAFADGHCEPKRWQDPRTTAWPNGQPYNPPNSDVAWIQQHTSAPR